MGMMANRRRWGPTTWPTGIALIAVIGVLALLAPSLLSRGQLNQGYVRLNRALASGDAAAFDSAERTLREVPNDGTLSRSVQRGLGLIYMAKARPEEAMAAWQLVDGSVSEALGWAERAERVADYVTAEQWYHVAVRLEPHNGDHLYKLARVAAEMGDTAARDYYRRALDAPKRAEFGRSNIMTRLGELEQGTPAPDWDAVLSHFDEAIGQNDFIDSADVSIARLGRAEALERLGQFAASLDEYRRLIADEPGLYWANVHGGRLTWYVERDAATAIALLRRAISINDDDKWAYLNLGLVYAGSGRPDLAVPLFEQVLAIDPNDAESRRQLEQLTNHDS